MLIGPAAQAHALGTLGSTIQSGYCLMYTRLDFGITVGKFPTALAAKNGSKLFTSARPLPGLVVPGYIDTASPAEHVITCLSDGRVVTVNGTHRSLYSSIDAFLKAWGARWFGYSFDLEGRLIAQPVTATLRYGATGVQNLLLQARLKWVGCYPGALDGRWGPIQQGGVRAFQLQHPNTGTNGKPDYIVGPNFRSVINAVQ
jgi:hypothetical protein